MAVGVLEPAAPQEVAFGRLGEEMDIAEEIAAAFLAILGLAEVETAITGFRQLESPAFSDAVDLENPTEPCYPLSCRRFPRSSPLRPPPAINRGNQVPASINLRPRLSPNCTLISSPRQAPYDLRRRRGPADRRGEGRGLPRDGRRHG